MSTSITTSLATPGKGNNKITSPKAASLATPAMFDVLVKSATRFAIGINNRVSLPQRGRLIQLLNLYANERQLLDEHAFARLLGCEFRSIPKTAYQGLFRYVSKHSDSIRVNHLVDLLLPSGFTKERSVLDFPCTIQNVAKKESLEEAAEAIRIEMIQHLRQKRISMRDYFDGIDADGSGSVDIEELVASLRHDNMGIGRYFACKSLVRRFDRSHRGKLTFTDFECMLASLSPKSQLRLERLGHGADPRAAGISGLHSKSRKTSKSKHRHSSSGRSSTRSSSSAKSMKSRPHLSQINTDSSRQKKARDTRAAGVSRTRIRGSKSKMLSPTGQSPVGKRDTQISAFHRVRRSPTKSSGSPSQSTSPTNRGGELPSPFQQNFELHRKAWTLN
eukprot:INCI864.1.p1 GENE.INCI864.1~~INCI864.1.p1  ORF type:complete len:390 (-),score=55.31 INCI864.1:88-1257(-)